LFISLKLSDACLQCFHGHGTHFSEPLEFPPSLRENYNHRELLGMPSDLITQCPISLLQSIFPTLSGTMQMQKHRPFAISRKLRRQIDLKPVSSAAN
jgi:hypothetical protein